MHSRQSDIIHLRLHSSYLSTTNIHHGNNLYFIDRTCSLPPGAYHLENAGGGDNKKNGVRTNAVITHINTIRTGKGGAMDILTMEYRDSVTNQPYNAKATVSHQKYKIGDPMPVMYLEDKPS